MKDQRLEPDRDLLMKALFDEATAEERQGLEVRLREDEELRREWEELGGMRAFLQAAEETATRGEPSPAFRLPSESPVGSRRIPFSGRWSAAAAGFAAAAALFIGLLLAGLRVDATPEGMLVHLGPTGPTGTTAMEPVAAADGPYLTHREFSDFAGRLLELTGAQLAEMDRRRSSQQIRLTSDLYQALRQGQEESYQALGARLEHAALWKEKIHENR